MTITAAEIAEYAPHGNAVLGFDLNMQAYYTDPATGNTVVETKNQERVEYLAALTLQKPQWKGEPGVDNTVYLATGRLLTQRSSTSASQTDRRPTQPSMVTEAGSN